MPLQDFDIQEELGRGAFGVVQKAHRKQDNKTYAIKRVKVENLSEKDCQGALNQIRILASVSGPCVIEYKQAFFEPASKELCVVMELAEGGDLLNCLKVHREDLTVFPEKDIWRITYEILQGLKTLHDSSIIHRDVKPANIFFCGGVAKLGDLNISKLAKNKFSQTQVGTPYYSSPEMWSDQPYTEKVDVWSLGCVVYQMAALKPPFRANNIQALYVKIKEGNYQKLPFVYSTALTMFIQRCLVVNSNKRATVDELLDSAFFKSFREIRLINQTLSKETENEEMMKTIVLPGDLNELNQALPAANYERKNIKKMKTVLFEQNNHVQTYEIPNKNTPLLTRMKSEKFLPPIEKEAKGQEAPKQEGLRKCDSHKGLRIHKVAKSMKLITDL